MGVYVDNLVDWGWRLGRSCHLVADTQAELHAFAERIGLRRRWFQRKSSVPHYDLTAGRRARALREGAQALDRAGFVAKMKEVRGNWPRNARGEWL